MMIPIKNFDLTVVADDVTGRYHSLTLGIDGNGSHLSSVSIMSSAMHGWANELITIN